MRLGILLQNNYIKILYICKMNIKSQDLPDFL